MEIFQSKSYKWFHENYPMTHYNMFQNYYNKLRQKYKWFVTYNIPFQMPVWVNGSIEEVFDFVKENNSQSITIHNNQVENPFKEPVEYVYYDTGDERQSKQKIYGTHNQKVRMDYDNNKMYFCTFENNKGKFSCGEDFFDENCSFLLFIGNYQYNVRENKCLKNRFTLVDSNYIDMEREDHERVQKFIKSMKDKKYNGLLYGVADRLGELF